MAGRRIVIADEGGTHRRISKIVPLGDGGYAVVAPYHSAREGWLAKYQVDYRLVGDATMPLAAMTHYGAEDRVKLSHHWDGFVQFSGEFPGRIVSGRDPASGEPRGLGLTSAPIRVPVTTGPTFGLTVWGLGEFAADTGSDDDIRFEGSDIYYRNCTPDEYTGFALEGWVFGERMWAGVQGAERDLRLSVGFRNFEGTGANLEFRVIPLGPPSRQFLGIMATRVVTEFPGSSGFVLTSPSNRSAGSPTAEAMMAMYPRLDAMPIEEMQSLMFQPPVV